MLVKNRTIKNDTEKEFIVTKLVTSFISSNLYINYSHMSSVSTLHRRATMVSISQSHEIGIITLPTRV